MFSTIVDNIGTVETTDNEAKARKTYACYVGMSIRNDGRAGGECVTLMCDGEIVAEHIPHN